MRRATMPSPEFIRGKALAVLSERSGGVRQVDLFRLIESALGYDHFISGSSIKNALWDLEDRYPALVVKKRLSARNVILYPTEHLISIHRKDRRQGDDEREHADDGVRDGHGRRLNLLTLTLVDIVREIELSGIEELTSDIQREHLRDMSISEIETVCGIKNTIEQIKKIRDQAVHQQRLR